MSGNLLIRATCSIRFQRLSKGSRNKEVNGRHSLFSAFPIFAISLRHFPLEHLSFLPSFLLSGRDDFANFAPVCTDIEPHLLSPPLLEIDDYANVASKFVNTLWPSSVRSEIQLRSDCVRMFGRRATSRPGVERNELVNLENYRALQPPWIWFVNDTNAVSRCLRANESCREMENRNPFETGRLVRIFLIDQ